MKYILPAIALILIGFGIFINIETHDSRVSFDLFDYYPIVCLIIKDKGDFKTAISEYKLTKYPYLNSNSPKLNTYQNNSLLNNPVQLKNNIENFEKSENINK